jgi:hypothetical protein
MRIGLSGEVDDAVEDDVVGGDFGGYRAGTSLNISEATGRFRGNCVHRH